MKFKIKLMVSLLKIKKLQVYLLFKMKITKNLNWEKIMNRKIKVSNRF